MHRFLIIALTVCHIIHQILGESNDSQIDIIPETGFECKKHGTGFYADPHPSSQCKVYHLCSARGKKTSFICPEGTLFHQQYLICAHQREVNCASALKYYHVNRKAFPVVDTQTTSLSFRGSQVTPSPPLPTLPSLPPEPFPRLTSFSPARHPKTAKPKPANFVNSPTVQEWPPRGSFVVSTVPSTVRHTLKPSFQTQRLTTTSLRSHRNQAALPPIPTTTKPILTQTIAHAEVGSRWSLPIAADLPPKKAKSGNINFASSSANNKRTTPTFSRQVWQQTTTSTSKLSFESKKNVADRRGTSTTRTTFPPTVSFQSTVRPKSNPNRVTVNRWENTDGKSHKSLTMIFPKKAKVVDPSLPVNDLCPLCDPYFLEPGTCMPCVIIR